MFKKKTSDAGCCNELECHSLEKPYLDWLTCEEHYVTSPVDQGSRLGKLLVHLPAWAGESKAGGPVAPNLDGEGALGAVLNQVFGHTHNVLPDVVELRRERGVAIEGRNKILLKGTLV